MGKISAFEDDGLRLSELLASDPFRSNFEENDAPQCFWFRAF